MSLRDPSQFSRVKLQTAVWGDAPRLSELGSDELCWALAAQGGRCNPVVKRKVPQATILFCAADSVALCDLPERGVAS